MFLLINNTDKKVKNLLLLLMKHLNVDRILPFKNIFMIEIAQTRDNPKRAFEVD